MKNKLHLLAILIVILMLLASVAGAFSVIRAEAAQDNPIKIWLQNKNGPYETLTVIDEKTGVNYIVVSGERYGRPAGITICPRYNADGSLYTGN